MADPWAKAGGDAQSGIVGVRLYDRALDRSVSLIRMEHRRATRVSTRVPVFLSDSTSAYGWQT